MTVSVLLKALHLLGVVLMLGNVIVTGAWSLRAVRTRNLQVIAFAQREVIWTDLLLTLGGGSLLTMSGLLLAIEYGYPLWGTFWIRTSLLLLGSSTLLWLTVLVPCQAKLARLAQEALSSGQPSPAFRPTFIAWSLVGWFGTALLVAALALMVVKPS